MEFTKEQIEAYKAEHGDVYEISLHGKSCLLREVTRTDLAYAATEPNSFIMAEKLLTQLWLEGDEEMRSGKGKLYNSTVIAVGKVVTVEEAEVKKL